MVVRRLPNSELYHHGIKGQEWGDRNGPPYPLDSQTSAAVKRSAKKKNVFDRMRDKHRMKKVRRAKVEKQKADAAKRAEQGKRLQEAQKAAKERAKVIETGDAKKISKMQHTMTDKEYERALMRVKYNTSLEEYIAGQKAAKAAKAKSFLNTAMNTATTVANIAESAGRVYTVLEKAGVVQKRQNALERLRNERDTLSIKRDISDLKYDLSESKNKLTEMNTLAKEAQRTKFIADINKNVYDANHPGKAGKLTMDDVIDELKKKGYI